MLKVANNEEHINDTHLSVLVDKTDTNRIDFDAAGLADLYGYTKLDVWNGGSFRMLILTDLQYMPIVQYNLPPGSSTKDLLMVRSKEVKEMSHRQ